MNEFNKIEHTIYTIEGMDAAFYQTAITKMTQAEALPKPGTIYLAALGPGHSLYIAKQMEKIGVKSIAITSKDVMQDSIKKGYLERIKRLGSPSDVPNSISTIYIFDGHLVPIDNKMSQKMVSKFPDIDELKLRNVSRVVVFQEKPSTGKISNNETVFNTNNKTPFNKYLISLFNSGMSLVGLPIDPRPQTTIARTEIALPSQILGNARELPRID